VRSPDAPLVLPQTAALGWLLALLVIAIPSVASLAMAVGRRQR
jgi:hypothetical protein